MSGSGVVTCEVEQMKILLGRTMTMWGLAGLRFGNGNS